MIKLYFRGTIRLGQILYLSALGQLLCFVRISLLRISQPILQSHPVHLFFAVPEKKSSSLQSDGWRGTISGGVLRCRRWLGGSVCMRWCVAWNLAKSANLTHGSSGNEKKLKKMRCFFEASRNFIRMYFDENKVYNERNLNSVFAYPFVRKIYEYQPWREVFPLSRCYNTWPTGATGLLRSITSVSTHSFPWNV